MRRLGELGGLSWEIGEWASWAVRRGGWGTGGVGELGGSSWGRGEAGLGRAARGDERRSGAQAAIGRVQRLVRLVGLGTE